MKFKSDRERDEFDRAPVILKLVANEFESLSKRFGIEPTITRILSPVSGESGVHQDYRAIDFRDYCDGKHTYTMDERIAIVAMINALYPRNDGFKVAIHHKIEGSVDHFHLQIPVNVKSLSK